MYHQMQVYRFHHLSHRYTVIWKVLVWFRKVCKHVNSEVCMLVKCEPLLWKQSWAYSKAIFFHPSESVPIMVWTLCTKDNEGSVRYSAENWCLRDNEGRHYIWTLSAFAILIQDWSDYTLRRSKTVFLY